MLLFLVSTLLPLVALLLPLVYLFKSQWSSGGDSELPPGKMGWPLVGETLSYFSDGRKGVPENFVLDRMRKFSSQIFKTSIFGEPSLVFCGMTGNKFLFSNENKLVRVWYPRSVDKIFPSNHSEANTGEAVVLRKLVSAFVKPEALQKYIGEMDHVTKQHFKDGWENKKEVSVVPLTYSYTFAIACKVFLNMDDPTELAEFERPFCYMAAGIWSLPINIPGSPFNKAIKASKQITSDLVEIIKKRRMELANHKASPTQDILSYMLTNEGEDGEVMDDSYIAGKIIALLIGGHDTSSCAITLVIKYLAELPHIYNGVLQEQMAILKSKAPGELLKWEDVQKMKYTWNVVCEVMRLAPPSQGTFREAIADFTFAGFSIPKGWKLYWSAYTTHMNADYFPDPEKFDPSRFEGNGPAPYTYVPFGGGPRMCPGKEYARLEICVFLHNLVTKYKWEKVIPFERIVVDPMPRPAKGLPIRLHPHAC